MIQPFSGKQLSMSHLDKLRQEVERQSPVFSEAGNAHSRLETGTVDFIPRDDNSAASEFDWSILRFGWEPKSGSPTKITLKAGSVVKNSLSAVSLADTDVTIGASKTYVGIQVKWVDLTGLAVLTGTSKPAHDDTWYKRWFYAFELTSGVAQLKEVNGILGDIDISGNYGS
jgi:hypothetical protein